MENQELEECVTAAKNGDRIALERLIERFHHPLFRMIYYRIHSRMDAEDLTQDVLLRMCEKLRGLKKAELFKSWLYRIALNRIRDFKRKKTVLCFFGGSADTDSLAPNEISESKTPADQVMGKIFLDKLISLTKRMSRMEGEIFLLRYADQMTIQEISDVLGRHESTIKTHLYRAVKKFKEDQEMREWMKGVTQ